MGRACKLPDICGNALWLLACVQVNAPLSKVFEVWRERGNYAEWFDLIGQVTSLLVLQLSHSHRPSPSCMWTSAWLQDISSFCGSVRPVHIWKC